MSFTEGNTAAAVRSYLVWLWQQYLIYFGIKNKPLNIEEH